MKQFNVVLFDGFETLDAFGPVEIIGYLQEHYALGFYARQGGITTSDQQVKVNTLPFSAMDPSGILLIPGGMAVKRLVDDAALVAELKALAEEAPLVLTVCNGSALLAKTGLLDGKKATSYKADFEWVRASRPAVDWVKKARWVKDGKFYTSSGVSAGIDMALGFVSDVHGLDAALAIAKDAEYIWNRDKDNDPFAAD